MSPDEVIEKVSRLINAKITRRTLLNYEKQRLIPIPERGGGGAGGRWTDYPDCTVTEFATAWLLSKGSYKKIARDMFENNPPRINLEVIAVARKMALSKETTYNSFLEGLTKGVVSIAEKNIDIAKCLNGDFHFESEELQKRVSVDESSLETEDLLYLLKSIVKYHQEMNKHEDRVRNISREMIKENDKMIKEIQSFILFIKNKGAIEFFYDFVSKLWSEVNESLESELKTLV